MKRLSLTQPWASLMANGDKKIETRSWSTRYRGLVAIHAAKGFPKPARDFTYTIVKFLRENAAGQFYVEDVVKSLPRGAIIATGRLVDVRPTEDYENDERFVLTDEYDFGDYSEGRFAWVFSDVRALPVPIPCKGARGLWEVPAAIAEAICTMKTAGIA